jgi:hypothetical protein
MIAETERQTKPAVQPLLGYGRIRRFFLPSVPTMKKVALYSRSHRKSERSGAPRSAVPSALLRGAAPGSHCESSSASHPASGASGRGDPKAAAGAMPARSSGLAVSSIAKPGPAGFMARHDRTISIFAALLLIALLMGYAAVQPPTFVPTQKDVDASVIHALDNTVLPSAEARAYRQLRRSVVRVRQIGHDKLRDKDQVKGVGTGVVIVDKGVILTSLHVVAGAEKVQVIFDEGTVSDAVVIKTQPENDLAVLQARTLPDDLVAATMRSTQYLAPGDRVIAIGYPFDIGPSVSAGVVSGMGREYRSPDGGQVLTNLIQFDAAANPGNSGGPLATMDGEVVGIVTAILNPTDQGVFIGIGFAVPIESAAAAAGTSPF